MFDGADDAANVVMETAGARISGCVTAMPARILGISLIHIYTQSA